MFQCKEFFSSLDRVSSNFPTAVRIRQTVARSLFSSQWNFVPDPWCCPSYVFLLMWISHSSHSTTSKSKIWTVLFQSKLVFPRVLHKTANASRVDSQNTEMASFVEVFSKLLGSRVDNPILWAFLSDIVNSKLYNSTMWLKSAEHSLSNIEIMGGQLKIFRDWKLL